MKCTGCGTKYESESYFYSSNDPGFCPECKRKCIEVRGKIVVKKEDLDIIKKLLK
jgi:NAD-dependent SIR2 family protein deacetylase